MRPTLSITPHCSVSASSTRFVMPAGVRAMRSQMITGFCASTSIFAAAAMALGIALRRHDRRELRDMQVLTVGNRILLQLGVERKEYRPHRRGRRDLVGAHRRLGEMLERSRLIVPFGEVAHQRADV